MTKDKKVILIVEDDEDIVDALTIRLEDNQYAVEYALNGVEGLQKLETVKPDLIILDLNMPQMGGIQFYEKICDNRGFPEYPVLVFTGRDNVEELFKDFNIIGFVTKPFDSDLLLEEIKSIFEDKITKKSVGLGSKKVMIIDHDEEELTKIKDAFLKANYEISTATSGSHGMKRMVEEMPDIAFIQLSLEDMPGDLVILKLKNLQKTQRIYCVLFVHYLSQIEPKIMKVFQNKSGIQKFIRYQDPEDLVDMADKILTETRQDIK